MIRILRYLAFFLATLLAVFNPARANDNVSIGDSILTFLDTPISTTLPPSEKPETTDPYVEIIDELVESIFASDRDQLTEALKMAPKVNVSSSVEYVETLAFAENIREIYKIDDLDDRNQALTNYFEAYDAKENWYLSSIAQSLTAYIYISKNQLLVAAQRIDSAMQVIPTELSYQVTEARLLATEVAMILHGMQGNPSFMLEAARLLQTSKAEIGETLNRHELMTNFVYALNRARDYESAAKFAGRLIEEPTPKDVVFGVSEVYMAETFNEIGEYRTAKSLALKALDGSIHPFVQQRGQLELTVALAGGGEILASRQVMSEQGWDYSAKELLETVKEQSILHAEALIAMNRGEASYALALMKRRADLLVGRVQSANSMNMTEMLSSLENTRERQSERESALQREAELRAVQLEQKTKLNRLLWILIAGLTIAFNFLLAFLRYREKLNVKVQGLQEDALSSEKMKTEFLGVINHELRTPLNGIIGISDAMIHHANDPTSRAQAEAIQESGQLLFDLLDSLITMSTIEGDRLSLDKEDASLSRTILREVAEWETTAANKNLAFTHFIGSELTDPVIADHKRIRQSLRFLLSNAIRFTHTGRVHLHATATPDANGCLGVTIIVADTGQGISEDVQSRLFTPFLQADATMTRKYGGAGLSLAIARKLARMMGGDLVVKSREGRGSEFTFTARYPLAETDAQGVTQKGRPTALLGADTQNLIDGQKSLDGPTPTLDELDAPEDIIDLMLGSQLLKSDDPKAERPRSGRFKSAG